MRYGMHGDPPERSYSTSESTVNGVDVACRTNVLSALCLRAYKRFSGGIKVQ